MSSSISAIAGRFSSPNRLRARGRAGEVVDVNALHHDHDGPGALVVETRHQYRAELFVGGGALGLRHRVIGFQRIVDDQKLRPAAGQRSADRGRQPEAPRCQLDLGLGILLADASAREQIPVTSAPPSTRENRWRASSPNPPNRRRR